MCQLAGLLSVPLFLLSLVWPKDLEEVDEDMKELLNDARLLKKLKKGKINEEDFERGITGKLKGKQEAAEPSGDSLDEDVWRTSSWTRC